MVLDWLARTAGALAQTTFDLLQRHPRRVMAVLTAVLLGTGATAFAVSQLVPDATQIQVQQVLQAVQPLASTPPSGESSVRLYRFDITRSNDTADSLLRRLGISDSAGAAFLRSDATARNLIGRAGRAVSAETDENNRLVRLIARWAPDDSAQFNRLVIEKPTAQTPPAAGVAPAFVARTDNAALVASTRLASGTIRSSLFAATDDARIPDAVAVQVAEIFSGDIDFHRALRKGDRFSVVYETLEADGEPLRAGRVLSAEFVNNGKTFQAAWFQEPGASKGQYYTLDGNSLRKAFLASPLQFSRVTSGFGMRVHPIARDWRAHRGVDYAAPIGTPIRSVGDGVVDFAGAQRGYGNVVEVAHASGKKTLYAHMNSISVRKGQRVSQSEQLGTVGRTGWATGPHLHFEFRVNGVHHDPLTLARQSESVPLGAAARPAFERVAQGLRPQLAAASSLLQASAQ